RVSELQYAQVMNNLAMMAENPSSLPYFGLVQGGKATLQLAGTANASVTQDLLTSAGRFFNKFIPDKETAFVTPIRQDTDEWDTTPDLDPIQEILMQGLYRKVLGCDVPPYQHAALEEFFYAKPLLSPGDIYKLKLFLLLSKNPSSQKMDPCTGKE